MPFHKWLAEAIRRTWNSGTWQCTKELKLANVVSNSSSPRRSLGLPISMDRLMQSIFRHDLPRKFAESFTSLQAITQAVSWMLGKGGDGHVVAKLVF